MRTTYQELLKAHKYEVQEFTKAPFTYVWVNSIKSLVPNIKGIVHLQSYMYEHPIKALYYGMGIAITSYFGSIAIPTYFIFRVSFIYSTINMFAFITDFIVKNNLIKDTSKFINLLETECYVNNGEDTILDDAKTFQRNVLKKMYSAIGIPIYLALIGFGLGNLPMLNLFSTYIFANDILAEAQEMEDEKAIRDNEPKRDPVPLPNFCMNWSTPITRSAGTSAIELM